MKRLLSKKIILFIIAFLLLQWQVKAIPAYYYLLLNGRTIQIDDVSCTLPLNFFHFNYDGDGDGKGVSIGRILYNGIQPELDIYTMGRSLSIESTTGPAYKYIGTEYTRTPIDKESGLNKSSYDYNDGSTRYIWWHNYTFIMGKTETLPLGLVECLLNNN
jgi:hypothetical protein